MQDPVTVTFESGREGSVLRLGSEDDLAKAPGALGLAAGRPVLVLVGGAGNMSDADLAALQPLFREAVAPLAERRGAIVLDGGTDVGVMSAIGTARAEIGALFPLVGVVAEGVTPTSLTSSEGSGALEPHHTHFVLVPGSEWGDEGPWLSRLATELSAGARSVTLLVNGGELSWDDVALSVEAGRPVAAIAGSGRAADELAAGVRGAIGAERLESLVASGLLHQAHAEDQAAVLRLLDELLSGGS